MKYHRRNAKKESQLNRNKIGEEYLPGTLPKFFFFNIQ